MPKYGKNAAPAPEITDVITVIPMLTGISHLAMIAIAEIRESV